jgi:pSer/pThr/pTyr-binding forkhead associated (FHA) protein
MSNTCQVCGTNNDPSAEFCEGCGVEIQASTYGAASTDIGPTETTPEFSARGEDLLPPGDSEWDSPPEWREVGEAESDPHMDSVPAYPPPHTQDSKSSRLDVKQFGALTGQSFPLQGRSLIVGRFDPSTGPVDIDVTGMPGAEHLSRRHAEVYSDGPNWMVKDLGSTNGVFVKRAGNDHYEPRLQEPALLHDGDEVAFGNVLFVYRDAASEP